MDAELECLIWCCILKSEGGREDFFDPKLAKFINHTGLVFTFAEFKAATYDPEILAIVFHDHYERSKDGMDVLNKRAANARNWYNKLGQTSPIWRYSGVDWCNEFKEPVEEEDKLNALVEPFKTPAINFIEKLRSEGFLVNVTSTRRPPERAYLMHYAWRIVEENMAPQSVPTMNGVYIIWDHGDLAKSKRAAQEMFDKYKLVAKPSLTSKHIEGKAMDITITVKVGSNLIWKNAIAIGKDNYGLLWGGDRPEPNYDPVHWYIN
jgi:hypothetical protein